MEDILLPEYQELVEKIIAKRKALDITQKELANRVGVSQSLIAKLEQEKNIPNYKTVRKICKFLRQKENSALKKVEDIANWEIPSLSPEDKREKAVELMNRKNLPSLPVQENGNFVGVVKNIDLALISGEAPVKNIMKYSFSIISKESSLDASRKLLENNDLLLVHEGGEVQGFITEKDLL